MSFSDAQTFILGGVLPTIAAVIVPAIVYMLYLKYKLRGAAQIHQVDGGVFLVMRDGDLLIRSRSLANALGVLMASMLLAGGILGLIALVVMGGEAVGMAIFGMLIALMGAALFFAARGLRGARVRFNAAQGQIQVGGIAPIPFSQVESVLVDIPKSARVEQTPKHTRVEVGVRVGEDMYLLCGVTLAREAALQQAGEIAEIMAAFMGVVVERLNV